MCYYPWHLLHLPSSHSSTHPSILWAQRNDTILLTVNLSDITDEKFALDEKRFTFSAIGGCDGVHYACELEFLKEVVPQVCVCVSVCPQRFFP